MDYSTRPKEPYQTNFQIWKRRIPKLVPYNPNIFSPLDFLPAIPQLRMLLPEEFPHLESHTIDNVKSTTKIPVPTGVDATGTPLKNNITKTFLNWQSENANQITFFCSIMLS